MCVYGKEMSAVCTGVWMMCMWITMNVSCLRIVCIMSINGLWMHHVYQCIMSINASVSICQWSMNASCLWMHHVHECINVYECIMSINASLPAWGLWMNHCLSGCVYVCLWMLSFLLSLLGMVEEDSLDIIMGLYLLQGDLYYLNHRFMLLSILWLPWAIYTITPRKIANCSTKVAFFHSLTSSSHQIVTTVCVCVCVCERERERESVRTRTRQSESVSAFRSYPVAAQLQLRVCVYMCIGTRYRKWKSVWLCVCDTGYLLECICMCTHMFVCVCKYLPRKLLLRKPSWHFPSGLFTDTHIDIDTGTDTDAYMQVVTCNQQISIVLTHAIRNAYVQFEN